ncbi:MULTISPECIES: DNA-processing protein DprA [unclassified Bifidobacterium]|uniref:DNA-processing protein DprA n=1 Tax=unclassified Bifidobacterium TaxID=2608897 RepID=UPI00226A9BE3|nr:MULTISPECIES: DNA-processing protein DprA [unclassified Bifidobacterium]
MAQPMIKTMLDDQPQPMTMVESDWLARTVLTLAADGPDAFMIACLLGSDQAADLCRNLIELRAPNQAGTDSHHDAARTRLDERFLKGTARWGRQTSPEDLTRFHKISNSWRRRLTPLLAMDTDQVRTMMTGGGRFWVMTPSDPCWPGQVDDLARRSDWAPPLCLWGQGNPETLICCDRPLAVVGSRTCDEYGRSTAHQLARKAAGEGHLVVSGGAMGTDAAAHWGALAAGGGRTVAVFAGGLLHMGPKRNSRLFENIEADGGALISELPPGTIPEARRFLLRNRIIAALASDIVVAQARHRSGALNTANWGVELGRRVLAAPGRIDQPENTGCNRLIHEGKAELLLSASDIRDICHPAHGPVHPGKSVRQEASASVNTAESRGNQTNRQNARRTPTVGSDHRDQTINGGQPGPTVLKQSPTDRDEPSTQSSNSGTDSEGKKADDESLTKEEATVLAAIRTYQRREGPPMTGQLRAELANQGRELSVRHLMQLLGSLEIRGLISLKDGCVVAEHPKNQACQRQRSKSTTQPSAPADSSLRGGTK